MLLQDSGFRSVYRNYCAFELNDQLRKRIQACPDVDKATHVVCYGYIDPKKGLMLEVLCAGKQTSKYFHFKDTYEGERITLPASDLKDVEFDDFENLAPRFLKKLAPRIEPLKKYDAPQEVEITREEAFDILDEFRDFQHPDIVRVIFDKTGLEAEAVPVRVTGLGDHCLLGAIAKKPKQDFGVKRGDTIRFFIAKSDDGTIELRAVFADSRKSEQDALNDGSFLKQCVVQYQKDPNNKEATENLQTALCSSLVTVAYDIHLSDEAAAILEKLHKEGKDLRDLQGEDAKKFQAGAKRFLKVSKNDGEVSLAVFTDESEINKQEMPCAGCDRMSIFQAIDIASVQYGTLDWIVINAFTDNLRIRKEIIEANRPKESRPKPGKAPEEPVERAASTEEFYPISDNLGISAEIMDLFSCALCQNKVPPIRRIQIKNHTGETIYNPTLRIYSDFDFFKPYEMPLPSIPSGKPILLGDPLLQVNTEKLAELADAVPAVITVELTTDGKSICWYRKRLQVLAYDQCMGGGGYRDLLPAFVIPTHPVISALMHDASNILREWGKRPSLEEYQFGDPNRVRELAAAAYAAIQKKNIRYADPPISFFFAGQKIRTPDVIMEQKLGTCMDMTLLYAALLEGIGLHPILVRIQGHIFAGVWLKERTSDELNKSSVVIDDIGQLTKRINNGSDELTFVECTRMCMRNKPTSFEEAEMIGKLRLLKEPEKFEMCIDVYLSRINGVKPIPPRVKEGSSYRIESTEKDEAEITEAPQNSGLVSITTQGGKPAAKITNKRELWESKLLDLGTRNMLLNLPQNASIAPIMSAHVDEMEDALADGREFQLLPIPEWIATLAFIPRDKNGKDGKPVSWLQNELKKRCVFEMTSWPAGSDFDLGEKLRQEFRNRKLYTFCSPQQLERDLTGIYRAARASQQENGVSSLYLAVGLLRWIAESGTKCYAPLFLIPVEMVRESANQGYALHIRQDEPHINATLLEMLNRNYNLSIPDLEPLPTDGHGIDIKRVFAIVRSAVLPVHGWDVIESCVIGNFSFAQFTMWHDIHTAGDKLEKSNVVRSLIKGHVDWDDSADTNTDEEETYLPITVDGSQLEAVKMAAHGTTFVLHGPPGTGKSQTITGMIANLMAQGKKVLFVAEKEAALSVVKNRLVDLGIDDFCLELHSDKANKNQVLSQLGKALAVNHPANRTEYEAARERTAAERAKLDSYVKHLHEKRSCGYSLRELVDLYESVGEVERYIKFQSDAVGELSKEQIRRHTELISKLTVAGEAIGNVASHPFACVGLSSYTADVRKSLNRYTESYLAAIQTAVRAGEAAAALMGIDAPQTEAELRAVRDLIDIYNDEKNADPALPALLSCDSSAAYKYYDLRDAVSAKAAELRVIWEPKFLKMDMAPILAKHEAAAKKFIGKESAKAAVTNEVQRYALKTVSYDRIPALLKEVARYQEELRNVENAYNALPDSVRQLINQYADKDAYAAAIERAAACKEKAEKFPGGLDAILSLASNPETERAFSEFDEVLSTMLSCKEQLDKLILREDSEGSSRRMDDELEFCSYLLRNSSELKDRCLYNQARQECMDAGLGPVVRDYEGGLAASKLESAYKRGFYYALISNIINYDDVLRSFTGATFDGAIRQFKRWDDDLLQQTKKEIYYLLASRTTSLSSGSPEIAMELALLRKAISSNARGMSIRSLFERIPHILQDLCPCMLMSPNSVAQYLAQENDLFDVVIFDEASQLPTCKAVGALYRAKSAVIVGDPKQMPPTDFFGGSGPEVDDLLLDDLDSILDDALALGIKSQHLQWHYRSTHESLIAFSNKQFYDNGMYTFPSSNDLERRVTAVHVNGKYDNSINKEEAKAIVEEIIRRFNDPELKKQSIGVITFNIKQKTLIEDLLAKQCKGNPELDQWVNPRDEKEKETALFVKNLENVQGDERDVILFSIGYGPDEKGHISMNFGPINKSGGEKRLNVAFSRSKAAMIIYESLCSEDIKVTETSPKGLIAFKGFLKFAEGKDDQPDPGSKESEKLARAGIMSSICEAITAHGYRCKTMVGHSNFRIDIAVVDPFVPTNYILGILLDGENYHLTKNTRDREIAQTAILKNRGWRLMRVWTIDWWENRDKAIRNILTQLDALKAESEQKAEAAAADEAKRQAEESAREAQAAETQKELEKQADEVIAEAEEAEANQRIAADSIAEQEQVADAEPETDAESPEKSETPMPAASEDESPAEQTSTSDNGVNMNESIPVEYAEAELPVTDMSQTDFAASGNRKEIQSRMTAILDAEAPVLKDVLFRRVWSSFKIQKTALAIDATEKAFKAARVKTTKQNGIVFCWAVDQDPKTYSGIRISNSRAGDEICPQEIKNAAVYVLKRAGALNKDDLVKEISLLFGYKRLGKNLETALHAGIQYAKASGAIRISRDGKCDLAQASADEDTAVSDLEQPIALAD